MPPFQESFLLVVWSFGELVLVVNQCPLPSSRNFGLCFRSDSKAVSFVKYHYHLGRSSYGCYPGK